MKACMRSFVGRSGLLGAIIIFVMVMAPVATMGLQQPVPDGPSPAQGHGQVIAQGVAGVAEQAAWRVVRDIAEPLDQAAPEERALGFALADDDALIVNDLSLGTQDRLAGGEAAFVVPGAIQQRASAGAGPVEYFRITLVPADQASDAGGDELLFAGDGFDGPPGGRDIDLVRDVLSPDSGEEAEFIGGETPSLLFVTDGQVTVEKDGQETLVLDAGEAGTIDGDAVLVATGAEVAAFVVAVVGPEVPPIPRFTGSVTIQIDTCPPGMTAETLDASLCELAQPDDQFEIQLLDGNGDAIQADSAITDGEHSWSGLPFGTYTIDVPQLPAPFESLLVTDADGVPTQDLTVTISRDAPDAFRVLFAFQSEEEADGTISLQVRACPEGMTPDTLAGDFCDLAPEGYAVQITEVETGEVLTLDDATFDGAAFVFSGLAVRGEDGEGGTYVVTETQLPPGYSSYLIVGQMPEPSSTSYTVVLTEDEPDEGVTIYNFLVADSVATPGVSTGDGIAAGDETPTADAGAGDGEIGSVTAQIFLCPEGSSPADYDPASCSPANGDFSLILYEPDGTAQTDADAEGDANTVAWTDLPPGDYFVEVTALPSGYDEAIAADAQTASNNADAYLATVSPQDPDVSLAFYLFPAA